MQVNIEFYYYCLGINIVAGLAGLACAYALGRTGHRVHVLDKVDGLHQVCTISPLSFSHFYANFSALEVYESLRTSVKFFWNGDFRKNFRKLKNVAVLLFIRVSTYLNLGCAKISSMRWTLFKFWLNCLSFYAVETGELMGYLEWQEDVMQETGGDFFLMQVNLKSHQIVR